MRNLPQDALRGTRERWQRVDLSGAWPLTHTHMAVRGGGGQGGGTAGADFACGHGRSVNDACKGGTVHVGCGHGRSAGGWTKLWSASELGHGRGVVGVSAMN